jgi:hypothetical protein
LFLCQLVCEWVLFSFATLLFCLNSMYLFALPCMLIPSVAFQLRSLLCVLTCLHSYLFVFVLTIALTCENIKLRALLATWHDDTMTN